jgi:hypothetical protein
MAAARAGRRAKRNGGEDEKTDEIEQRARYSHRQTGRIEIQNTLPRKKINETVPILREKAAIGCDAPHFSAKKTARIGPTRPDRRRRHGLRFRLLIDRNPR